MLSWSSGISTDLLLNKNKLIIITSRKIFIMNTFVQRFKSYVIEILSALADFHVPSALVFSFSLAFFLWAIPADFRRMLGTLTGGGRCWVQSCEDKVTSDYANPLEVILMYTILMYSLQVRQKKTIKKKWPLKGQCLIIYPLHNSNNW